MANESNINIRITRAEDEVGTPSTPDTGSPNTTNPQAPNGGGAKKLAIAAVALNTGKQALNFAQSQVQFYTGSQDLQDKVNMLTKLTGYGIAFAVNPVLGLGAIATDTITNVIKYNQTKWEESLAIARTLGRAGVEYSRSRGL